METSLEPVIVRRDSTGEPNLIVTYNRKTTGRTFYKLVRMDDEDIVEILKTVDPIKENK